MEGCEMGGMIRGMGSSDITQPPKGDGEPGGGQHFFSIDRELEELDAVDDGWADGLQDPRSWGSGMGKAVDDGGLEWLKGQFAAHYPSTLERPLLYPTPEGGVLVEWSMIPKDPRLEIDLETREGVWHFVGEALVLDLQDGKSWRWLAGELRRLGRYKGYF